MINLLWVGAYHNSPIDPAIGGTQDLRLAPFDHAVGVTQGRQGRRPDPNRLPIGSQ